MFKNLLDRFRKDKLPPILVPHLMDATQRQPVSFVRGEGSELWDIDGNRYLDTVAGYGATVLGHSHPEINKTISLQAGQLLHVGNGYHIQEQALLAEKLCDLSSMDKVLFCDSPVAAYSAAIYLTVLHGKSRGISHPKILSLKDSLPNRANPNSHIESVAFNDIDALGEHAGDKDVVAVLIPSIHCHRGLRFSDDGYFESVRKLCDEHSWLLIADESLTSPARTGQWFAYQHNNVLPDAVFGSTGLANGLAIGIFAARGELANALQARQYTSAFSGNPLTCQTALKTLELIKQDDLLANATKIGDDLRRRLQHQIGLFEQVIAIRGKGLFIVIEFEQAIPDLAIRFLLEGLAVHVKDNGKAVRMTPALNLTEKQSIEIAQKTHDALSSL